MGEQYKYDPNPNDPLSYLPPNADDWKPGGRYYNKIDDFLSWNGQTNLNESKYLDALKQYQKKNVQIDQAQGNANIDSAYDPRVQAYAQLAAANKQAKEARKEADTPPSNPASNPEDKYFNYLKETREANAIEAEKEFSRSKELIRLTQEEARKNALTPEQQIGITTDTFRNTNPYILERIRAENEGQTKSTQIQAEAAKYGYGLNYRASLDSNAKQLEGTKYQSDKSLEGQLDSNAKQLEGTKYQSDAELSGNALSTLVKGYTDSMGNSINRIANVFALQPNHNLVWRGR